MRVRYCLRRSAECVDAAGSFRGRPLAHRRQVVEGVSFGEFDEQVFNVVTSAFEFFPDALESAGIPFA